ncbi:HK97 family phage prohead protease [Jonesiaceae bacterium BS-20]|uniref:HK97 family phage prohead protease n=1 Tax=Jonesiaceae bacterium BS-20 TaxID=3120821 RepID=A0AAU7DX29_9MICO
MIAQALGSPTSHDPPAGIAEAARKARWAAINVALDEDLDVDAWVIHSWPSEAQMKRYEDAGAEVHTIDPGLETVLAQAEADERPAATIELIHKWYEQKEEGMKTLDLQVGSVIRKTMNAEVSKVSSEGNGSFEALVAVFGNRDSYWDVVMPGAFEETLKSAADFPCLWAHQFNDETAIIGRFTAEETKDGLLVKAGFLDTERAQRIRHLMQEGLIREFSWSGKIREGAWVHPEDGDEYYEIRKVDLWEAGPCFKGANDATELIGVKSTPPRKTSPVEEPKLKASPEAFSVSPSLKARLALSVIP